MVRIYLYGIIEGTEDADLGISGVDGAGPVRIVVGDGLGGVVSDYTGGAVTSMSKEELVKSLLRHQEAVEQVMRRYTVLPVKFGTSLGSVHEVRTLLRQAHNQLANALIGARDKVEMDVAATWDTASILREIGREETVARVRERVTLSGPPTVAQQVQLGQVVKAAMDTRRSTYRDRMVAFLEPLAVDMVANPLMSDEMVMNVAFLVARSHQGEFDAAVQGLDSLFQNEITFRVIGPLPPHSFSTLEVSRLAPEEIAEAQQALQLEEGISVEAVRRAYRRLAAEAQRVPAPDSFSAQDGLARLRQASELLLQYCSPHSGWLPGNGSDTLAGREGDGLFVVAVKRSDSREIEPARFGGLGGHGQ